MKKSLYVGVIGFSDDKKFNKNKAKEKIKDAFDKVEAMFSYVDDFYCVSGLTDYGIPALAYREAKKRGWETMGIACEKALDMDRFPVDYSIIFGKEWGDESGTFLKNIEILVKVGGGEQSEKEFNMAMDKNIPVLVFDI